MPTVPLTLAEGHGVPIDVNNHVAAQPMTNEKFRAADVGAMGEAIGKGLQGLGEAGAQFAQTEARAQDHYDEAAATQAVAQLSEYQRTLLTTGPDAYYSKQGADAINARPTIEKALADKREELFGQLKNPRQQQYFGRSAAPKIGEALEGVARYEQQQTRVYQDTQSEALSYQATQDAIVNADNPEKLYGSIATVRNLALQAADRHGLQEVGGQLADKAVSDAFTEVVKAKAAADPLTAKRFLDQHRDAISPTTQAVLDHMLEAPATDQWADEQSDAVRGVQSFVGNPNAADLVQAITGQESGGRNGLRSPKGALGVMQVMPGTAKQMCEELGIAFDPDKLRNDPAYCTRLGTAYMQKMLGRYGGNSVLALAAYNAGPGAVDGWLKSVGDPRTGAITNEQWAARIPFKETRDYVPGVLRRLGSGGPKNVPRDNDLNGQLAEVDRLAAEHGWDQKQTSAVKEKVIQKGSLDSRLLNQQQQAAYDKAWALISPATGQGATSIRQVPPDVWAAMSPQQRDSLQGQIKQNAKAEEPGPNPDLYYKLSTAAASNPEGFAKLDLRPYAAQMPKGDWQHFVDLQKGAIQAGEKDPKVAAWGRIWGLTKASFETAGFDTGAKAKDSDKAALMGFQKRMVAEVSAWTSEHKKAPTDEQIQALGDKLLMTVQVATPGRLWGTNTGEKPLFQAQGNVKVPVPNAVRDRIVSSFQRSTGRMPSEQLIASTYLKHKGDLW